MIPEKTVKYKSFHFSLAIIKIYQYLIDERREYVMSKQLLRSATSIGALIREADHAESTADFIHKMAIAQKEANETAYWLELLMGSGYLNESDSHLHDECNQIQKMLASIIITTKSRGLK